MARSQTEYLVILEPAKREPGSRGHMHVVYPWVPGSQLR